MPYNIKSFQLRYNLSNKDIADICNCSLPTIQKWRSGEVPVSGAAGQLMKLIDLKAEGKPDALRRLLKDLNKGIQPALQQNDAELSHLEDKMSQVVDRLEYMLEKRRRDRELAESEARYRSMVDSYAYPVCRWLPDTTLTFVNEAYRKLFAHEDEQILGRKWIEFLPENARHSYMVIVSDIVRRGEEEVYVHEVVTADGKTIQMEWRDIPVKNESGQVVELHSIGMDMTELIELRRIKDESVQTRDAFMNLSTIPFVIFNEDGYFIDTNRAFEHAVMRDRAVHGIADMLSVPMMGKFKRLLKRIHGKEAFSFQLMLDDRAFRMGGRLINREKEGGSRYLAMFEELSEIRNRVTHVRIINEIIVDGKVHELNIGRATQDRIETRMNELGNAVDVDRVYVFTYDWENRVFDNILEWCAPGVDSHIDDLQQLPVSEYPWWTDKLVRNQWIQSEDTAKMPRSAFREREILVAQGIRSILVAPVVVNGETLGFVGFDQNHTERIWHDQEHKSLEEFKREIEILLTAGIG